MAKDSEIFGSDERLKKSAGEAVRGNREGADASRTQLDGSALSAEERRRALRQEWVQEVLPTPPQKDGMHRCWLSTTNSTDPIHRRIQMGYTPVKSSAVPGFGSQYTVSAGEFEGCIACNEMLLFEIPQERYIDLMTIYHHDIPMEQEEAIYERVLGQQESDSSGRKLMSVEGDFNKLGRGQARSPSFA